MQETLDLLDHKIEVYDKALLHKEKELVDAVEMEMEV